MLNIKAILHIPHNWHRIFPNGPGDFFPLVKIPGKESGPPISYKDLLRDFIKDMVLLWFAMVLLWRTFWLGRAGPGQAGPGRTEPELRWWASGLPKVFIFDRFYKGLRLGEMPCEFHL